ncbi:DUF3363 domain-containing protein [Phenylobacterium terrae]|uniref:DUF3363 domain-containing protein n=1 Tax=Phenylobacterium terrae TaxID=2665495 RepID=A0ABW4N6M2_9CAUL
MLVRDAIETRLGGPIVPDEEAAKASLPRWMRGEGAPARTAVLRRLSASRVFALGDRSGVLRAAQARSGRPFRLDLRQRVVVKALVSRHTGQGRARGAALGRHVAYLGRSGAGAEGGRPEFFDRNEDAVDAPSRVRDWAGDRHHFRFIVSPEHGDRIADLKGYVRAVMGRVAADLGEPDLVWVGTCHVDTDQPHAHVLVRGRRGDGRDLVIPRDYIAYGFRARAQEVAQERLGDLSRAEAERRVWRETEANRFTGLDRRLLAATDAEMMVDDGVGRGPWAALSRGRLRHLERLGLAAVVGRRYRLTPDLEAQLRTLQAKQDVIRTLNARRLQGARAVLELGERRVRGRVVQSGAHDELGASRYVVVRDEAGVEHYARLGPGSTLSEAGRQVDLAPGARGAQVLPVERGGVERGA